MKLIHGAFLFASIFLDVSIAQDGSPIQGFNSGNTFNDYKAKFEDDFTKEFNAMRNLPNAPGVFNSARIYTMIQAYTESDVISAIPAAIKTNTSLLLGIWCSGTNNITNELKALGKAIEQYGDDLARIAIAVAVGSEDLYRNSELGIKQHAGIGQGPKELIQFIDDTRKALAGTPLAILPVGHVEAWRGWANLSNSAVVDAVDFLGTDDYSFFENDTTIGPNFYVNTIDNASAIFDDRLKKTQDVAKGKPVWVTETGWPYISKDETWGKAEASTENQARYWREVGCGKLFGKVNTWWYTLVDSNPVSPQQFAILDDKLEKTRFDVSCTPGASDGTTYQNSASRRRSIRNVFGLSGFFSM